MSVLGDVFGSLKSMSQLQLLLAFIACIGYAFAQGSLLLPRGRRVAWCAAALAATGFALESADWTYAAMLLGFAVVGMGSFVAAVWLTSRAIGFGPPRKSQLPDSSDAEPSTSVAVAGVMSRAPRPSEHAHSI